MTRWKPQLQFAPPPPVSEIAATALTDVFSGADLDRIHELGHKAVLEAGSMDKGAVSHRRCCVAWLKDDWLTAAMLDVMRNVNRAYFDFDLDGFAEPLQYTVYGPEDHYGWHMDKGPKTPSRRKLSFTLQLSDPSEYEGGDLEIQAGADVLKMPKERGQLVVFPSWILHRVTPVTKGVRRSLVAWASGPSFA